MKKQIDLKKLSEAMEKECVGWETEEGLSEETRKQLLEKVMEAEIQKEAEKHFRREKGRMRIRYVACTIALLVMVMGMGVLGERIWKMQGTSSVQDGELSTVISNGAQENLVMEDEKMYQEIKDALGIAPMQFGYVPEGMALKTYRISEETGWACVEYIYQEQYVYVQMCKHDKESLGNIQWDGSARKLGLEQEDLLYDIEAYCVDLENNNYGAMIHYGDAYYDIQGRFEDENVFLEILYGIYFENL